MKKLLLNLYFWPAFLITTIIGLTILPVMLLLNSIFTRKTVGQVLRFAIRIYGLVLVRIIPFMAPVDVIGNVEEIPRPCILTANHNSAIDPYLYGAVPIEICFITSWPFKIPVYGPLMKIAGYINTNDGWDKIRQQGASMLNKEVSLTIWPEGHRSRNGLLGRFRKGAFQLAVETGYPIQPVCIIGSADIMRPGERLLSPGRVKMVFLPPLFPLKPEESPQDAINDLRKKTFSAIQRGLEMYGKGDKLISDKDNRADSQRTADHLNQSPHDVY